MVKGSTWMVTRVEELGAREVVELEVKLREELAVVMKFEFEAVLLVEVEGRQVWKRGM